MDVAQRIMDYIQEKHSAKQIVECDCKNVVSIFSR